MTQIALIAGMTLIVIGIWGIISRRNIIRMIIGFSLFDTGLHVILVVLGYIRGKAAPILSDPQIREEAVVRIVDPIPQALVLTAIVIGLAVTALMLTYALKLYQKRKSLDIDSFEDLKW
jgi:multicomponent Na+:H+ antiporter subunit C